MKTIEFVFRVLDASEGGRRRYDSNTTVYADSLHDAKEAYYSQTLRYECSVEDILSVRLVDTEQLSPKVQASLKYQFPLLLKFS